MLWTNYNSKNIKKKTIIHKGQFVSFDLINGYLEAVPYLNNNNNNNEDYLMDDNGFTNPYNIIGVALEDSFFINDKKKNKE